MESTGLLILFGRAFLLVLLARTELESLGFYVSLKTRRFA